MGKLVVNIVIPQNSIGAIKYVRFCFAAGVSDPNEERCGSKFAIMTPESRVIHVHTHTIMLMRPLGL